MEFSEKLQTLRKQKGLTQEELAQALFVSRTAISKWESGKGYPSIDSLKEISKYFSITIDELLSSEELITAAQDDNRKNIADLLDLLTGCTDIMALMLLLLPLYPEKLGDTFTAVSLLRYTQIALPFTCICWGLMILLIAAGAFKLLMHYRHIEKGRNAVTGVSFILSIITVLFLTATRLPYAVMVVFLLLVIKGILAVRSHSL